MSTRYYGPDDTWPAHEKDFWRKALAQARAAGWALNHFEASHRFGDLHCPGDPAERHTFTVGHTARGGETKAKQVEKMVRDCQHGTADDRSKVRARRDECARLLDEAERLITLADTRLTAAEASQAALAELERLQVQLETAEASLAAVLRAEEEAAWQAAIEVDGAPDADAIAAALDEAVAAVAEGELMAGKIRRRGVALPLLERVHAVDARIKELRVRLQALESVPGA